MNKATALLIPLLALAAVDASAGDEDAKEHKKCAAEASSCIRDMAAGLKKRGWIGIEWDEEGPRPVISHVVVDSPAARAGLRVGDVVMAFEGTSTDEDKELIWAAMKKILLPGRTIRVDIVRDGTPRSLEVELVAVPDHIIAQWVGMHVLQHHAAPPDAAAAQSP